MSQETREIFRSLSMVSSIGVSVVLAIGISAWLGLKLDEWLGTSPYLFYVFLLLGIAAGFNNIYVITRREIKKDGDQ